MFRNGMWVLFEADLPGAFHSRDGRVVGIIVHGDDTHPPYIAVVKPDGENLVILVGSVAVQVKVSPNQPGLEPVTDRRDIPESRIAHLPSSWQPAP